MQYGQENMRRFAELKSLLDPSNVMNPGKILANGGALSENLPDSH